MKEKIKRLLKNRIFLCLLTALIVGTVSVSATTYFASSDVIYDNSVSGLESTNVQGAIDELYNACKIPPTGGNGILDKVDIITSGDGLYKDEYEDGRYFYKGKNVNNWITFNKENDGNAEWRIISIEPDMTIKIIKWNSIGDNYWDTSGNNNWARPSSLNTYLNVTYYNSLSSTAKGQIVSKDFSIGATSWYKEDDLKSTIETEDSKKWTGKVALITMSEYIKSNSDKENCGTMERIYNSEICGNTTWISNNTDWWTLTPAIYGTGTNNVYYVIYLGGNNEYPGVEVGKYGVRPVVYISSEVKITGGDGSQSNPYTIS